MRRVLREWRGEHDLTWHKNKFTCGASETGTCYGSHQVGFIDVVYEPCLAYTSLGHELIHFFNMTVADVSDGKHNDERFFDLACRQHYALNSPEQMTCRLATVETNVAYRVMKEICPNGYKTEEAK